MSEQGGKPRLVRPNRGYEDLRELISIFEEIGEIERIEGADWKFEVGAVAETTAAAKPGRAPAILFDKIAGYPEGFRIVSGGANAFRRLAVVLGLDEPRHELDLVNSYRVRMREEFEMIPPVEVETGPIFENVLRGDDIDVLKFPVPWVHEHDGGRYIGTEDLVVMRDPDTGWVNSATYRVMVHDAKTVAIWMSPGKHGRFISQKYFDRGEPCPVLICCGQDPLLFLTAHQEIDIGTDELAYAGGLRGRAIPVVKSEVHGLPIPAHAEVVIEARSASSWGTTPRTPASSRSSGSSVSITVTTPS